MNVCDTVFQSGAKKGQRCGRIRCAVHHKEFKKEPKIIVVEEPLPAHKNHIFVFDTETTGLSKEICPRLVQVAWRKYDSSGELLSERCILISPDQFIIPDDAVAVHHLSQEYCENYGVPIKDFFAILKTELMTVGRLVAHNIRYDDMIISNELERYGETELLKEWKNIYRTCTMNLSRSMKITTTILKLAELYKYCFLREAEGELHQADTDTRLCAEIYFYLSTLT